jgi:hypothetical protein
MDGEIKALEMLTQYKERGVFKWVPQLKNWLRDPAYKFWLGTVQNMLGDNIYPTVGLKAV